MPLDSKFTVQRRWTVNLLSNGMDKMHCPTVETLYNRARQLKANCNDFSEVYRASVQNDKLQSGQNEGL